MSDLEPSVGAMRQQVQTLLNTLATGEGNEPAIYRAVQKLQARIKEKDAPQ